MFSFYVPKIPCGIRSKSHPDQILIKIEAVKNSVIAILIAVAIL